MVIQNVLIDYLRAIERPIDGYVERNPALREDHLEHFQWTKFPAPSETPRLVAAGCHSP